MIDENVGGNELAQQEEAVTNNNNVDSQNTSSESKIDPGQIRKSQTQGILNALSKASGQNLSSVEDAVAFIARSTAQSQLDGSVKPMEQSQPTQRTQSVSNNDLQEQFHNLQQKLSQKETALKGKELESDILQSGQERYGQDGNPFTLTDLVNEVATGNPKLLKQTSSTQSGSGLRPGQTRFAGSDIESMPDYSRDPAAFKAWQTKNGLGRGAGLKGTNVNVSDSRPNRSII